MARSGLSLRALRAGFGYTDAVAVFSDASFVLSAGWAGLVGENGSGKSTLLRLIAGELSPSEGVLRVEPDWSRTVVCPQSPDLRSAELEALAEASDAASLQLRRQLQLDPRGLLRFETLSPGERKRWQVAAALYAEPEVLLLDEPTNHLDAEARAWLLDALRGFSGVGLLVSHDRALLDALTRETLRVHHGRVQLWSGPYSKARSLWEAERITRIQERQQSQAEQKRQRALLDRLRRDEQAAARQRNTGRRMKNAHDSDARSINASMGVEWSTQSLGTRVAARRRQVARADAELAEIELEKELGRSVFVQHERAHRSWLLQLEAPLALPSGRALYVPGVARAARIWLRGPNGAGKSTLLRALIERSSLPPERLLYLPQSPSEAEEVAVLDEVRALAPAQRAQTLSIVAALGVDPTRLLASRQPSPGEARKLAIARGLAEQRWLLVLDEPENHLDLPSIERLERALAAYPGALLLVSHDAVFARALTDCAWDLSDGELRVRPVEV